MKVIFLDVDGVLNSRTSWCERVTPRLEAAPIARLRTIVERTGARIVVSSINWRWDERFEQLVEALEAAGLPKRVVIDRTPELWVNGASASGRQAMARRPRGEEIAAWLAKHPDVEAFVILDDDADMGPHGARLVQTTFELGLQDVHVAKAIALLQGAPAAAAGGRRR